MRCNAHWLCWFPIAYFRIIASCRPDALGIEYVFSESRKAVAALGADLREHSLKVFADHLDDFVVGHGEIVSPRTCPA